MSKENHHTKYIFITGGVVSSLGKGIVAASIGTLLEQRGLCISISKADPYLNIDPGTMNPNQHGEVFVTEDGAETDLDLGHYERFTTATITRQNSFSTGQVYDSVLNKERHGNYLGRTVQVVPHITNQIKENIFLASKNSDISIIEIGGTVGDIESLPFLETMRQIRYELGEKNVLCIHLTLVPYIAAAKELKTKPTQHSVKELRSIGIQPDMLFCRADRTIPEELRTKIAIFCNVLKENVIEAKDIDSIYKIPLLLSQQKVDEIIVKRLNIWTRKPDLTQWKHIVERLDNPQTSCHIAIVGKYTGVVDSYKSIEESLIHAGIANNTRIQIHYVNAQDISTENVKQTLHKFEGIIVPGGFGQRGISGKIEAIRFARENNIPFLEICLGMQLAAIEFAKNVLGLPTATSYEFDTCSNKQIIHLMQDQKNITNKGGTMRLGAYPCLLHKASKAHQAYQEHEISERHRHRYEFNNQFRQHFQEKGMLLSGLSPDESLVEIIELSEHPWFVACQFHPELKSKPTNSHPLFRDLIKHALQRCKAPIQ